MSESEFLKKLNAELATANTGEGLSFNLFHISKLINSRISELNKKSKRIKHYEN